MINNWESLSEIDLIYQVVLKRNPELLPLVALVDHIPLTDEQREDLRGSILGEFLELGLYEDYEPNAYGLRLSRLINYLGRDM